MTMKRRRSSRSRGKAADARTRSVLRETVAVAYVPAVSSRRAEWTVVRDPPRARGPVIALYVLEPDRRDVRPSEPAPQPRPSSTTDRRFPTGRAIEIATHRSGRTRVRPRALWGEPSCVANAGRVIASRNLPNWPANSGRLYPSDTLVFAQSLNTGHNLRDAPLAHCLDLKQSVGAESFPRFEYGTHAKR
jgi:hypothetical protein